MRYDIICIGICRKVKLNYFLVSHGHCDGDRDIGRGGMAIANVALPTFETFEEEIVKAFQNYNQSFTSVQK